MPTHVDLGKASREATKPDHFATPKTGGLPGKTSREKVIFSRRVIRLPNIRGPLHWQDEH